VQVAQLFLAEGVTDFYILQTRLEEQFGQGTLVFKVNEFASCLARLVRAVKSFNDCMNDAARTMRDRVAFGRIDGERMVAAHEVLFGNWTTVRR